MKEAFIAVSGMILQVAVGASAIFLFKWALISKSALGRFAGKIDASTKGLTNAAKDFGESRNFYQRRQQARDQRKGEQRRENVSNYAEAITADNWRGRQLRRRSSGGVRAQIVGAVTGGRAEINAAGQERVRLTGVGQREKLEHEETQQAGMLIDANQITSPAQLQAIAAGATGRGVGGQIVNSAGNHALQRAAIQKLIEAQDAEELENLFMNRVARKDADGNVIRNAAGQVAGYDQGNVNIPDLIAQVQKGPNYSTTKGAGAHLVAMHGAREANGSFRAYTQAEVQQTAMESLGKLSRDKIAQQDGPSWQSALEGFRNGVGDPNSLEARKRLWKLTDEVRGDARAQALIKDSAKQAYNEILRMGPPTT